MDAQKPGPVGFVQLQSFLVENVPSEHSDLLPWLPNPILVPALSLSLSSDLVSRGGRHSSWTLTDVFNAVTNNVTAVALNSKNNLDTQTTTESAVFGQISIGET